ncbi:DUF2179 domain-containing protein [Mycoplasmopsis hyopharyngis]|uniref:DUF2179 domain-containing protein n=1 Tax=Mycoplasmopsis hyopharyngis TaxID=29558 RepID=UPI0038739C87
MEQNKKPNNISETQINNNKEQTEIKTDEILEINETNCQNFLENISSEENDEDLKKLAMGKYFLRNIKYEPKTKKEKFKFIVETYWKRVLIVFISALIFNFGINTFISRSETIPSCLTGLPTLLVLIFPKIKPYFALIYLAANVPLFLTFGLKEKKSFVFLTLLFMIFQIPTNFIFTIPVVNEFLYNTFNLTAGWTKELKVVQVDPPITQSYIIENPNTWPILLYGILGAISIAVSIALTWKSGGSTGGTDIVIYYFATKSKKNVAFVFSIVSLTFSLSFLVIFRFAKPHTISYRDFEYLNIPSEFPYIPEIAVKKRDEVQHITSFGMRELSTLLYILINNIVLSIIYPKYAKVQLEISCSNYENILKYFKRINFWHSYTIRTVKSGYTGNKIYIIDSVMLLLETKNIVLDIKKIEPTAWISIKPVRQAIGKFNTRFVE